MKATYFTDFGGPEVFKYGDVPDPTIGASDVLIRVHASALNHLDLWRRAGQRGTKSTLSGPMILGCDIAGEVAEVGPLVKGVAKGDRVLVNPGITCGRCDYCLSARDNMCNSYVMIGSMVNGGYAQYAKAPQENVHKLAADLTWEEAAAMPLTFLTAYHMLMTLTKLKPGETVLIQAVGSGVGVAALQIAKLVGARTIVTASTDGKLGKARLLGADYTINYDEHDFAARVKEITEGKGVDVVFDHVGQATFEKNIQSMTKGGRFVNCGITSGYEAKLHMGVMFTKQIQLFGSYMGTKAEMSEVVRLANQGKLRGIVSKSFELKDAGEAHKTMESRDLFGKLVLKIP